MNLQGHVSCETKCDGGKEQREGKRGVHCSWLSLRTLSLTSPVESLLSSDRNKLEARPFRIVTEEATIYPPRKKGRERDSSGDGTNAQELKRAWSANKKAPRKDLLREKEPISRD